MICAASGKRASAIRFRESWGLHPVRSARAQADRSFAASMALASGTGKRIGTLDISTISPDHAVTTESFNASQIEILRGPATLLYGSGAPAG